MEHITESSEGRLPLLKHHSNQEFLEATYKVMKLLFAQDNIPMSWYRHARSKIAARCKGGFQKFFAFKDPTPDE